MDKRVKYSIKFKAKVVRSILARRATITGSARDIGCRKSTVERWTEQFKQHGVKGLAFRNGRYDGRFKVRVVRYFLKKGLSLNRTASYFKIPNECAISRWLKTYEQLGAAGLLKETRGRKKTAMTKKPTKRAIVPTDPGAQKLAELQKEVEYLRAENAFLKKLEALVQQENAAKAQGKRQRPSRN